MEIPTVNVITIEPDEGTIQIVNSYTDNDNGNEEAEKTFVEKIKEHDKNLGKEDINNYISDGHFEDIHGYSIYLVHSTKHSKG